MEEHICNNVIPKILKYYNKNDYKVTKYEIKPCGNSIDNWSSILYDLELNIAVESDNHLVEERFFLFMKSILDDHRRQKVMQNRKQFSNEIHIYNTVCPIFKKLLLEKNFKLFVEVPYAVINNIKIEEYLDPQEGILILENLKTAGYKLGPRTVLDVNHCVLALQQLGRWHALSLAVKVLNPEQFHHHMLPPLEECVFNEETELYMRFSLTTSVERVCRAAKYPESSKMYQAIEMLQRKCDDIVEYMKKLLASSQKYKFSVLCHGDYCRNNILFKYNENEEPTDAIPIDYQYARYGSPGLDLSFFMYMNTGHETRKNYFMTLIKKYHESLVSTMTDILIREQKNYDIEISSLLPSLDDILQDFREHGAFGLIHAFYFVPWMMGSEEELQHISKVSIDATSSEYYDAAITMAGETATAVILEIFDTAISSNQIRIQ